MLRVLAFGMFVTAIMGQSNFASDVNTNYSKNGIDPIIVGHSISDAHKQQWAIKNKKYKECGLCGEELQPYPGE